MSNIEQMQYDNLRKHFNEVVFEVLGEDYWNMAMDVYHSDIECCKAIIEEYKKVKRKAMLWFMYWLVAFVAILVMAYFWVML